jgi:hypothetical protein
MDHPNIRDLEQSPGMKKTMMKTLLNPVDSGALKFYAVKIKQEKDLFVKHPKRPMCV